MVEEANLVNKKSSTKLAIRPVLNVCPAPFVSTGLTIWLGSSTMAPTLIHAIAPCCPFGQINQFRALSLQAVYLLRNRLIFPVKPIQGSFLLSNHDQRTTLKSYFE